MAPITEPTELLTPRHKVILIAIYSLKTRQSSLPPVPSDPQHRNRFLADQLRWTCYWSLPLNTTTIDAQFESNIESLQQRELISKNDVLTLTARGEQVARHINNTSRYFNIETQKKERWHWEDQCVNKNLGYFTLFKYLQTDRDKWEIFVLGRFADRHYCEDFIRITENNRYVYYAFTAFDTNIDHIDGHWCLGINKNGEIVSKSWSWLPLSTAVKRHNTLQGVLNIMHGIGRTKQEALENAHQRAAELAEFKRKVKGLRPEDCYCHPWTMKRCAVCKEIDISDKRKKCGCPHCLGDHD